ncbi:MAG: LmbE family N-acetylglucosaminyl deacetylase [Planctomycetota bacterium]
MNERAPLPVAQSKPARGRVLVLVPHPDDDVIGCGGTASLHALQGDPVRIVVVYDGAAGDPEAKFDAETLIERRHAEARAGGVCLGLEDYEFWDYPEGHEPDDAAFSAGAKRIAQLVRDWQPDIVYAPWIGEFHLDHHVLARIARAGLKLAGFKGTAFGYEVWTPLIATLIVDVTNVYAMKVQALRKHVSQVSYGDPTHYGLGLNAHRSVYLPEGAHFGEAFSPLGEADPKDMERIEPS